MSDFTSDFWSLFIAIITVVSIAACVLLLWLTAKMKITNTLPDGTNGHEWDGIKEMNNPLPRWWVWLFVLTIIFGVVYLVVYPGLGSYAGQKNWTSTQQYQQEVEAANAALKPLYAKFAATPIAELAHNEEARGIGERLFLNNCAQCHGSDARGSKGFPNLTDADWLYGKTPEAIKETITNGRTGIMPPMAAAVGSDEDLLNLANYVLSLSDSMHSSGRAKLGEAKYAVCAACHGADGKGNTQLGAPNLTDNIWLHGAGEKAIIQRVKEGKMNQMPAWEDMFSPEQIHVLAAYVWGLSPETKAPDMQKADE